MSDFEQWQKEAQAIVSGGVSTALDPEYINESQVAWGVNCSFRDGKPKPRFGLRERAILPSGKVNGATSYKARNGMIVMMIDGFLHYVSPTSSTFTIEDIPLDFQNYPDARELFFAETQTGKLIIQNGIDTAIIYDGSTTIRAASDEIPKGKHMAVGNGRIWVHDGFGRLYAGDIAGAGSDSELLFTENIYFGGGGSFALPGVATGMAFIPVNDSNTGYGPLVVFGQDWTVALRADIVNREQWQDVTAFQTQLFPNIGCISHQSIISFNQDLFWRDGFGELRSLRQAIVDSQTAGNSSLSKEVSRIVNHEGLALLSTAPSVLHKNKILFSASPYHNDYGWNTYRNLISMDVSPTSSMAGKSSPIYDGEWDGIRVTHAFNARIDGVQRAFIISRDDSQTNRLWEIMENQTVDLYSDDGTETSSRIKWQVEYRKFFFGSGVDKKKLSRFDMWLADISGTVDISVYYRRDDDCVWYLWDTIQACQTVTDASTAVPHVWKNLSKGQRPLLKTLTSENDVETMIGNSFQIQIVVQGSCKIDRVVAHADYAAVNQDTYAFQPDESCQECEYNEVTTEYLIPAAYGGSYYVDGAGNNYTDENGNLYGDY